MSAQTETLEAQTDPTEKLMRAAKVQTPWWVVSILAHGLIIVIAALLTLVIEMPEDESDFVPMVSTCAFSGKVTINERVDQILPIVVMPPIDDQLIVSDTQDLAEAGILGSTPDFDVTSASILADETISESHGDRVQSSISSNDEIGLSNLWETDVNWMNSRHNAAAGATNGTSGTAAFNATGAPRIIRCYVGCRVPVEGQHSALQWLASHQDSDGHWAAMKHGAAHKNDTAVTALALLAFLVAGNSERVGGFKSNVQKAVAWLESKQAADGSIWDTSDDGATHRKLGYPNALATLALTEAAGMGNLPATRAAAQKAVDYCTQIQQSASGGWRYSAASAGDLSVTSWYIMALKSAKIAGLKVPPSSFDAAIRFLDSVEIKSTDADGHSFSQYKYMPDDEHAATAYRLTAIGLLARQYLGWKRDDLKSSVEWFVKKGGVPNAGANGEGVDLYYWFHGTLSCYQHRGELWQKWREGLLNSLLSTQCRTGADAGSWNPAGEFSSEWGRVGQTALSVQLLEFRYNYVLP